MIKAKIQYQSSKKVFLNTKIQKYRNSLGSTREAYNYTQAKQLKCQIITMPPKVINQIINFGKSFKSLTVDTVRGFLLDSKKSKFKI